MSDVLRDIEKRCDVVLIVTPPHLDSASAAELTAAAGRAIVVASDGGSITNAEQLARRLRLSDATTLGYIYSSRRTSFERTPPTAVESHDDRLDGPGLTQPSRLQDDDHKKPKNNKEHAPVTPTPIGRWPRPVPTPTPAARWPRPAVAAATNRDATHDPPLAPSVPARPNGHPATVD
jgi:hypothetical protein